MHRRRGGLLITGSGTQGLVAWSSILPNAATPARLALLPELRVSADDGDAGFLRALDRELMRRLGVEAPADAPDRDPPEREGADDGWGDDDDENS